MRVSEAGLALITRVGPQDRTEYLTQWNAKWQAYSLIGGHRQPGESFRECCVREIEEELGLKRDVDFRVAAEPLGLPVEYTALSLSVGVETRYRMDVFETVVVTAAAMAKVAAGRENCWLTEGEIGSGVAGDGRSVAVQAGRVLRNLQSGQQGHP